MNVLEFGGNTTQNERKKKINGREGGGENRWKRKREEGVSTNAAML